MVLEFQKILKPIQVYMLSNAGFNNFAQKSSLGGVLALLLLFAVFGTGLGPDGHGLTEKTLNQSSFTYSTTFVTTTLPRIQALGTSLLSAYPWLSMALGLAQIVLDVWKNFKPT